MKRLGYVLALLCLVSVQANAQQGVYSSFDSVVSSEAVPINDMLTGWDGSYQRGELVYADVSWSFGIFSDLFIADEFLGRVSIQREYRHYYYLNFDKETADYYRAVELGDSLSRDKKLDLTFKQFDAPGISLGYDSKPFHLESVDWQFGIDFAVYQPGHFQFGSVKGVAEAGDTESASGVIDYRFDEDKLLDTNGDLLNDYSNLKKGLGLSLSANITAEFNGLQVYLGLKDVVNQFTWQEGLHTTGCVNLSGEAGGACVVECPSTSGNENCQSAAGGQSNQARIVETIPTTLNTRISHISSDISFNGLVHDRYYRLGLEKGVQTSLGRLGFFLYYPRLVGLSWQASHFNIELGADTFKLSQARNVQLNMGINWRW